MIAQYVDTNQFSGENASVNAVVRKRKHGSGVTYILYQHLTDVETRWDASWLIVHVRNGRYKVV